MSQENVEVVRRWIHAYNRRDIEGLLELSDSDIEFHSIFAGIESGGAFRGSSGVHEYFEAIDDVYESFQVLPDEFFGGGAGVVVLSEAVWTGRGSGAGDQTQIAVAVWLRKSKVMRVETFTDRDEALDAVGMSDKAASATNVEVARKVMEAVNQLDRDAWLSMLDPEFEFRADPEWPESETVHGREAAWDFVASMVDAWEPDDFEMVEVIHAGDGRLVGRFRRPVRGKASGVAAVLDYWAINTFRRGRLLSQEWFASRADALEAAELSA